MSQSRQRLEQAILQGQLPLDQADNAAIQLAVYPNRQSWLAFFDKALLIIAIVALVLALVFFIAYNWLTLGKMGKFALVEGALLLTIAAYLYLVWRHKLVLLQQLLLFIASIITGSLLALFGQVYQTGADSWQLFFNWALLIIPWVIIARLPTLWLLFLGLLNAAALSYLDTSGWRMVDYDHAYILQLASLAALNSTAFVLWLCCFDNRQHRQGLLSIPSAPSVTSTLAAQHSVAAQPLSPPSQSQRSLHESAASHHWSTYILAILSSYYASRLAMIPVLEQPDHLISIAAVMVWLIWCAAMYGYFRKRVLDVFMLTCLCFSLIAVVLVWVSEMVSDQGGLIVLFVLVLLMSSLAVAWLRKVSQYHQGEQHGK